MVSENFIHGENLKFLPDLLSCALENVKPAFRYTPDITQGRHCFTHRTHLQLRIGLSDTPRQKVKEELHLCQKFGRATEKRSGNDIFADFTAINLDTLKPNLTEGEKAQAKVIIDQILQLMDPVAQMLNRPVSMNHSQLLERNVASYKAERTDRECLQPLDRKLEHAGSAMRELDLYTALQLDSWLNNGSSRSYVGYGLGVNIFNEQVADFHALQDTLQNTSAPSALTESKINPMNTITNFGGGIGAPIIIDFLLQTAPRSWIDREEANSVNDSLSKVNTIVQENRELLLKITQLRLYEEARSQVQQAKTRS